MNRYIDIIIMGALGFCMTRSFALTLLRDDNAGLYAVASAILLLARKTGTER